MNHKLNKLKDKLFLIELKRFDEINHGGKKNRFWGEYSGEKVTDSGVIELDDEDEEFHHEYELFGNIIGVPATVRDYKKMSDRKIPVFLSQMGLLYTLSPERYGGIIDHKCLNFLARYRRNLIFLLSKEGFLNDVMMVQATKSNRIEINYFFAQNIETYHRYQFISDEYQAEFDLFKPVDAKPASLKDKAEDIVLKFF